MDKKFDKTHPEAVIAHLKRQKAALSAENSRLEALVHRLQATSMEQAKSGEKLQDKLDEADAAFEESDTACA
ncbi:hypothetical protein LCGC14_2860110, partial [marine sediment metagenome]